MNPIQLTLELAGIVKVIGETPPTPEQWLKMKELVEEATGALVAKKFLEQAEEALNKQNAGLNYPQYQPYTYQPNYGGMHNQTVTTTVPTWTVTTTETSTVLGTPDIGVAPPKSSPFFGSPSLADVKLSSFTNGDLIDAFKKLHK